MHESNFHEVNDLRRCLPRVEHHALLDASLDPPRHVELEEPRLLAEVSPYRPLLKRLLAAYLAELLRPDVVEPVEV